MTEFHYLIEKNACRDKGKKSYIKDIHNEQEIIDCTECIDILKFC